MLDLHEQGGPVNNIGIILEGVSVVGKTVFLKLLQATLSPGKLRIWAAGEDTWGPDGIAGTWMPVFEDVEESPLSRTTAIQITTCRWRAACTAAEPRQ